MNLSELFSVETLAATDSQAIVRLKQVTDDSLTSITGSLRGPRCRFAKTLPSTISLVERQLRSKDEPIEMLVTDPCYWSPQLPFHYDLEVTVEFSNGSLQTLKHSLGLNRWECFAGHLRLEGRRTVLRGGNVEALDSDAAREAGIAALTSGFDERILQTAGEAGVPLLVDLRDTTGDLRKMLASLSWFPAVAFAVIDESQSPPEGSGVRLAQAVNVEATIGYLANWASTVLLELQSSERPPNWLRECGRPVLVRQRAESPVEMSNVRQHCDTLQASLAPEFDFAGYFIG